MKSIFIGGGAFGFIAVNGAFAYGLLFQPDALTVLTNPLAAAFIARGHSNAEIAEAFVISKGTVKTHVKRVLSKLDLRDRTQAAAYAYQAGFVKPVDLAQGPSEPIQMEARRCGAALCR